LQEKVPQADRAVFSAALAFLGYRCETGTAALSPKGFYFWLGPKVTKTQGLDLMSDKFVKAFRASAQVPTKGRKGCAALGSGEVKVFAEALTFSPSIISQAG